MLQLICSPFVNKFSCLTARPCYMHCVCTFKTMDQKQFRVLILHCFLMEKNTVQAKECLEKCYKDSAPSETTIKR